MISPGIEAKMKGSGMITLIVLCKIAAATTQADVII